MSSKALTVDLIQEYYDNIRLLPSHLFEMNSGIIFLEIAECLLLCMSLKGVIKSEPDAWLWLGDFAYLDSSFLPCEDSQNSSQCFECSPTFLRNPPDNCMTGDLDHALAKIHMQVWIVHKLHTYFWRLVIASKL